MTARTRLRAALATLLTILVGAGLWAIPVASADSTHRCVTAYFANGSAETVSIPSSVELPTNGSELAADRPSPALTGSADSITKLLPSVCVSTGANTYSTTTTSPITTSTTSTTAPDSTTSTTSTTTTTTTTSTPTTTTAAPPTTHTTTTHTTTTHTTTTPPTKTTTGPHKSHRQPSSSSPSPGSKRTSNRKTRHHHASHKHHKHHRSSSKAHRTKQRSKSKSKPKSKSKSKSTSTSKSKSSSKATHHHIGGGASAGTTSGNALTLPSTTPVGVPDFFLDSFQIPPFLLPIYQAAGIQYQVPWQVLAGINEIETDYGRNLSVSSAGAVGWMQFEPSTWKEWGIDANGDGVADPYNPVDAIFTAARYLQAAGAATNLPKAIFAYNHADWYVQQVLLRAKLIGALPQDVVGALTGLVEGRFPVAAAARYSDDSVASKAGHRVTGSNASITVDSDHDVTGTTISAKRGSPVIAVNDGKIVKVGDSATLGRYIELQDATGNVYTYSQLGSISSKYPVPKPVASNGDNAAGQLGSAIDAKPTAAASAGTQPKLSAIKGTQARLALTAASRRALTSDVGEATTASSMPTPTSAASAGAQAGAPGGSQTSSQTATETSTTSAPLVKERLFAHPSRPASFAAGGRQQLHSVSDALSSFKNYFADTLHLAKNQYTLQPLRVGSIVVAGTILGRLGAPSQGASSHLYFQIQPAGHDAPDIDPKPILDGWKLLQATAVYRANGVNPFYGGVGAKKSENPTVGQVLLMSEQQLEQRVLNDPHVAIYSCGRRDIEAGKIDRRVLAAIEYLSTSGLHPDVTGLACDASVNGTTGVDEAGSTGQSVDISKINGISVEGHTGPGSITDQTIRRLLALQGSMAPTQIVSPISYRDQPTTLALPSHQNRIQILFGTSYGSNGKASKQVQSILKPAQWTTLINRLSQIPEPVVPVTTSRYAIREHTH